LDELFGDYLPKKLAYNQDRGDRNPESNFSYVGHVLMENRHGRAVDCCVTQATGRAEPDAALAMAQIAG
jgi:hypothetical protein